MHELGIVFYIIKDVKSAAQENKASEISSVTIQLGEVSGVIPEYLTDCWKWAIKKEGSILEKSELVIETIPAVTYCETCGTEFSTIKFAKKCPRCKCENTYLIQGNEVMIKDITAKI